jgi:hypothetical protein
MMIKNFIQNYFNFFIVILLQFLIQIKTQKNQIVKHVSEKTYIKSIEENIELFFEEIPKKNKNLKFLIEKDQDKENNESNILLNYFSKEELKDFIFDMIVVLDNLQEKKIEENFEYSKNKEDENIDNNEKKHKDSLICKSCLSGFKKINWLLHQKYGFTIFQETLALICSAATDYSVCRKIVKLYSPEIFDALLDHYFDAEYICTFSKICSNIHFKELNADDYAIRLLKDKPQKKKQIPNLNPKKMKFVHITDIHFDRFYQEVNYKIKKIIFILKKLKNLII